MTYQRAIKDARDRQHLSLERAAKKAEKHADDYGIAIEVTIAKIRQLENPNSTRPPDLALLSLLCDTYGVSLKDVAPELVGTTKGFSDLLIRVSAYMKKAA